MGCVKNVSFRTTVRFSLRLHDTIHKGASREYPANLCKFDSFFILSDRVARRHTVNEFEGPSRL